MPGGCGVDNNVGCCGLCSAEFSDQRGHEHADLDGLQKHIHILKVTYLSILLEDSETPRSPGKSMAVLEFFSFSKKCFSVLLLPTFY